VAPPFRTVEFDIMFGTGIDKYGCLLDAAETYGVVERRGSWYNKGEMKIAQGRRASIEVIKSNPKLLSELETNVRVILAAKMKNRDFSGPDGGAVTEEDLHHDHENEFNMAGMEDI
jgi:recombination protein RecA